MRETKTKLKHIFPKYSSEAYMTIKGEFMKGKLSYENETRVPIKKGQFLCFESFEGNNLGTSYVRIVDKKGNELAYWVFDEWKESPEEVMGAIMGVIAGGI